MRFLLGYVAGVVTDCYLGALSPVHYRVPHILAIYLSLLYFLAGDVCSIVMLHMYSLVIIFFCSV